MTELLLRVFNKRKYWEMKAQEMHNIMTGAEFRWRKAIKWHEKSADLSFEYKLARLNFEKAVAQLHKVRGF